MNGFFYIYSSDFQKNEYYLYTNCSGVYKYLNFQESSSLLDIVMYDSTRIKFLNTSAGSNTYSRLYFIKSDVYINVISCLGDYIKTYLNYNWHVRECYEFFGTENRFLNSSDCRNLLTDYSERGDFLKKSTPLSGYKDSKSLNKSTKVLKKNSVIL